MGLKFGVPGPGLALAGLLLAVAGAAYGDDKPSTRDVRLQSITVEAQPIASFDKLDPNKSRFGKLTWRGGLVLTASSPNFGGWSGLALGPGGEDFLAVSDAGTWMSGRIQYQGEAPEALQSVRLGPLKGLSGETLRRGRDVDAEGLALLSGTPTKGTVLVAFERNHRIWRYDIGAKGLSAAQCYGPLPAAVKRGLSANSGLEALAVLKAGPYKGALVAFAERRKDEEGNHIGWIWTGDVARPFSLSNAGDYDVTDAAALPDGGLLVLERRFRMSEGVKTRLRRLGAAELKPGARLAGETLLQADMNEEIDNMEGLAVHETAAGEIAITLISDDNFNKGVQRTLLLQFTLP